MCRQCAGRIGVPTTTRMLAALRSSPVNPRGAALGRVTIDVFRSGSGTRGLARRGGVDKKDKDGISAILEASARGELQELSRVTVAQLRAILRTLGMPTSGARAVLLQRITSISDASLRDACEAAAPVDATTATATVATEVPAVAPLKAGGRTRQTGRGGKGRSAGEVGARTGTESAAQTGGDERLRKEHDLLTGAALGEREKGVAAANDAFYDAYEAADLPGLC